MTPEQIIELADDCGANVYKYQSLPGHSSIEFGNEALMKFAKLIEAATREECAKLVEQDMYPTNHTAYLREYNDSIKVRAKKIRSGT